MGGNRNMTSLQDKIDTILDENHPTTDIQHFIVISEAIDKAIQELREQIDNYPILNLENCVTPEARNALQEFQTIVLDLIGEKK